MKPLPRPARLALIPIGAVPRALLVDVATVLRDTFGPEVVLGAAQDRPAYAFNKDRGQYHASAIVRRLAQSRGAHADAPVLGVADVDLFVPDAPYVFGEADRDVQAAVVSLARLSVAPDGKPADPDRLRRRLQAEAVHEMGHLLGLSHCQDLRCAMLLSHKATDADRKGPGLCVSCRAALGLA